MVVQISRLKKIYSIITLSFLLFAMTCLYSEANTRYFYLAVFISGITTILNFLNLRNLSRLVSSKYFIWLVTIFAMYNLWGVLFTNGSSKFPFAYINMHFIIAVEIISCFIGLDTNEVVEKICDVSIISSIMSIIYVVINEKSMIMLGNVRIGTSASGNVDVFGMYLGIMSIFILYRAMMQQKKIYYLLYGVQVAFMLLTGSKQALIYIIVAFCAFTIYTSKKKAYKYIIAIAVAIAFIYAIFNVPVLYELVGHRIQIMLVSFGFSIDGIEASRSTDLRMDMIRKAFDLFWDNPIFGGGYGYFATHSGFNVYSHNTYTEILVSYGLFGFILYYLYFFKTTTRYLFLKNRSKEAQLFLTIMISVLLGDTARITFSQTALNYVLLFLAVYVLTNERLIEKYNCDG